MSSPTPDSAEVASGLSSEQAAALLAEHGPNRLAAPEKRSALAALIDQFRNLLIVVLICAAVLAGLVGEVKDSIIIAVVLILNAVLGFVQEHRAERSLDALRSMLIATATVRRNGRKVEIPAEELVKGDIVLVEAGDRIPADGRVIAAYGVEIDESSLTGESTPVAKVAGGIFAEGPLGDRVGAAFMNTTVTRGRAEIEITATGMDTEIGAVAGMLRDAGDSDTPLQVQLDILGKRLAMVAGVAVLVFIALEMARGGELGQTLLHAVALAVAAIPEGLPAVVTVTLAVGTSQMAKRGAIVKRLASVETLGATSVICSDKTGTLTLNQMTARVVLVDGQRFDISGQGYNTFGEFTPQPTSGVVDALLTGVLCNESAIHDDTLVGDPTEGALVAAALKAGIDVEAERRAHRRVAELPFDSAVKLMATFHLDPDGSGSGPDGLTVHVKGALDVLLDRTTVGADERSDLLATMDELAGEGLRILGLARRRIDTGLPSEPTEADLRAQLHDLELVGVVGLVDPPRAEAREAITICHRAGIAVKMITGDHAATARAIADQLGIRGEVVTGAQLDDMSDEELTARIGDIGVVARVSPEHKVRIVRSLRDQDQVVAMTGDGVNDAPALKAADIGVAMGITGTEVSKEAAAMVLTDDNFATIVRAVEQGRTIYTNIVTFVRFQLATNIGAILSVLVAPIVGLPVPFTAVQLLWVNIIMDGPPAMALGVDPPRPGIMALPPRERAERILTTRRLGVLAWTGGIMATGTLSLIAIARESLDSQVTLTMAFTTFVMFQVFNALSSRTELESIFRRASLRNRQLWIALVAVLILQVVVVHWPAAEELFATTGLSLGQWAICVAVGSSVLWLEEIRKAWARRRSA